MRRLPPDLMPLVSLLALLAVMAGMPALMPAAAAASQVLAATPVPLPGGEAGIGLDDLTFSHGLGRILVPGGLSNRIDLIDPENRLIVSIPSFRLVGRSEKSLGRGVTSADEGRGLLFVIDRSDKALVVIDPKEKRVAAAVPLAADSEYVRFVATTREVWVTQPSRGRIEVFSVPGSVIPTPMHKAFLAIPGGPGALVADPPRGSQIYVNLSQGSTLAIDVRARTIVGTWNNGCGGTGGLALDARRGFLFVGCAEGKAVVLDLNHGGAVLDTLAVGGGVDGVAYTPELAHLYLTGTKSAILSVVGVSAAGKLSLLGTVPTNSGSRCVTADDHHQAWVCDPGRKQLLVWKDGLPAGG